MSASVREIETAATSPLAAGPMQRIAARFAARADHTRPDPALTPAHGRHRPFAQNDLDLSAASRDHDPTSGAPGNPHVEGPGYVFRPRERDRSPLWDSSNRQSGRVTDEATNSGSGFT